MSQDIQKIAAGTVIRQTQPVPTRQPYTPPVVTDLGAFANPAITGSGVCCDEQINGNPNMCRG